MFKGENIFKKITSSIMQQVTCISTKDMTKRLFHLTRYVVKLLKSYRSFYYIYQEMFNYFIN